MKDPRPLNAKSRPFSWSYSALSDFEGCPKRYAAKSFYYTAPWVETEAIIWGNKVHAGSELMLNGGHPDDPAVLKELEPHIWVFMKFDAEAEVEVVLDRNMQPLTGKKAWFSKDAWFRAKLDVVISDTGRANYYDWKTGKNVRDDTEQIEIGLAGLSILRPEIEKFVGKLVYTRKKVVTGGVELDKAGVKKVWENVLPRVERMQEAWRVEAFPARASGLCPWCSEYDKCEYARRR